VGESQRPEPPPTNSHWRAGGARDARAIERQIELTSVSNWPAGT
jgi:hypothetical protein